MISLQTVTKVYRNGVTALEDCAPLLGHSFRVLEVLLEEPLGIANVQTIDIVHAHLVRSSTRTPCGGGQ